MLSYTQTYKNMKKITITLLMAILFASPIFSQWSDISAWVSRPLSTPEATASPFIWYEAVTSENLFIDLRYGFDWNNTMGLYVGPNLQNESASLWASPQIGLLYSADPDGFNGFGPEVEFGGESVDSVGPQYSFYGLGQYAHTSCDEASFFYGYLEMFWEPTDYLKIGYAGQAISTTGTDEGSPLAYHWIETGPVVKITLFEKFYFKPWFVWSTSTAYDQKIVAGIGYTF